MVTAPGVVTGRSGTIGKVNYIECDYWPHNTTLWVTSFKGNVPKFIYYLYQGIKLERFSTGSGVPTLNRNDVHAFRIAVPPLPEQHAIAKAISDVDALLAKLDQLITKKRDLKQATMQQLLTGQTRLPGFSGEWEVKRLGKLFDVLAGGDFKAACSSVLQDEQHPFPIYSNSITDSGLYGFCSYGIYPKATITVTARGTVGAANYRDHSYTAIGRVLVLLPKQNLDGRFFSEFINNRISFVVESTGVPQLTAPQISKYELQVPNADEQAAIATTLSDMDTEITALETRRDKTRDLKQGMMQELLTGRIRLI
jgi:type I restriction enzyme S subunit